MKILIANRGEIAVRVIRTARELNIPTVAVYSTADAETLAVDLADEAVCIGPPPARDSYLNISNVLGAAEITGCEPLHQLLVARDRQLLHLSRCAPDLCVAVVAIRGVAHPRRAGRPLVPSMTPSGRDTGRGEGVRCTVVQR